MRVSQGPRVTGRSKAHWIDSPLTLYRGTPSGGRAETMGRGQSTVDSAVTSTCRRKRSRPRHTSTAFPSATCRRWTYAALVENRTYCSRPGEVFCTETIKDHTSSLDIQVHRTLETNISHRELPHPSSADTQDLRTLETNKSHREQPQTAARTYHNGNCLIQAARTLEIS